MNQQLFRTRRTIQQRNYLLVLILTGPLVIPFIQVFHFNSVLTYPFSHDTPTKIESVTKQLPNQTNYSYQPTQLSRIPIKNQNTSYITGHSLEFQEKNTTIPILPGPNIDHQPFRILGDDDFITQGWPGSGTFQDPYRIENLNINASGTLSDCIEIRNTQAHFIIANCNLFEAPYMFGIHLFNTVNATLRNNTCWSDNTGILMCGCSWTTIQNNTFIDNNYDIQFYDSCQNNLMRFNTFQGYYHGVYIYSSHNNTIANNTFLSTNYPISLSLSHYNKLSNNTINEGHCGISLWHSNNNTITYNNCQSREAIELEHAASNLIQHNTLFSNWRCIDLYSSSLHNKIINNTGKADFRFITAPIEHVVLVNNSLIDCGIEFSYLLPNINQSNFQGNTINGQPIIFCVNQTNAAIPANAAQIFLFNCSNIQIENRYMSAFTTSVLICFSTNIRVQQSLFYLHHRYSCGTRLEFSDSCTITCNRYRQHDPRDGEGLTLISSRHCHIIQNQFDNCDYGISITQCAYIEISENRFTHNWIGIRATSFETITISDNLCEFNRVGIYCNNGRAYSILNNICSNNENNGIEMYGNEDGFMYNNTCEFNEVGISLLWERSCIITDNVCIGNSDSGIWGAELSWLNISSNVCSNNSVGIYLEYMEDNNECAVSHNLLIDNGHGISLVQVHYIDINYNNCSQNLSSGINLQEGSLNFISDNFCVNNFGRGIQVQNENSARIFFNILADNEYGLFLYNSSTNNQIVNNIFIENRITNCWDEGEANVFQRNYWSDYVGWDLNGDGYGDIPFIIPGSAASQDPFPQGLNFNVSFLLVLAFTAIFLPITIMAILGWRLLISNKNSTG